MSASTRSKSQFSWMEDIYRKSRRTKKERERERVLKYTQKGYQFLLDYVLVTSQANRQTSKSISFPEKREEEFVLTEKSVHCLCLLAIQAKYANVVVVVVIVVVKHGQSIRESKSESHVCCVC